MSDSISVIIKKKAHQKLYKCIPLSTIDKYTQWVIEFDCSNCNLLSIPTFDLPQLQIFKCYCNQLISLPDMNYKTLEHF